jgi:hypothetical protein
MPLRIFDRGLKNPDELKVFFPEGWWEWDFETIRLGHFMVPMGIGRIAERNLSEVLRRLRALESIEGPLGLEPDGEPKPYDEMIVVRRVGLAAVVNEIPRPKFDAWIKSEQAKSEKKGV